MQCTYHPETETVLRCSRCDRPICGRCVVQTPVGGRCRECARPQLIPTYTLGFGYLLRGLAASIGTGLGTGAALGSALALGLVPGPLWWLFVPLALAGTGYVVGEATSRATNRKRAPASRWIVGAGFALSYVVLEVLAPGLQLSGLYSLAGLVVGAALAISRVR